MKIKYILEKFPIETIKEYPSTSYLIEGKVYIEHNEEERLMLPEWPLIEFLVALLNWRERLASHSDENLYYISMDSDDKPILSFTYKEESNLYEVYSFWFNKNAFSIYKKNILQEIDSFYYDLRNEILEKYNYDIDQCISGWSKNIGIPNNNAKDKLKMICRICGMVQLDAPWEMIKKHLVLIYVHAVGLNLDMKIQH